jgi:hypothetical protein
VVGCVTPAALTANHKLIPEESMPRLLSDTILKDLNDPKKLAALIEKVRNDDTLMLAIRDDALDVYYRGGRILRLERNSGGYHAKFDSDYSRSKNLVVPKLPAIKADGDCNKLIDTLPTLKEIMNFYFATKRKSEREFQQVVAWENNRSAISSDTEYFITDVEFADAEEETRVDMLGLKWLSKDRKDGSKCKPVLIEMKYGIGAYSGDAGIVDHIKKMKKILDNPEKRNRLNGIIEDQFNTLSQLGLVRFNKSKAHDKVKVSGKPEVVFLLANHNPRSKTLLNILKNIPESDSFDLRFFSATFAGYGMHDACMLTREQMIEQLGIFGSKH